MLSIKQINQNRCSLLTVPVAVNLIKRWFSSLVPSQDLQVIQIDHLLSGGLFDAYYNTVLTNQMNTYIVRFYTIYIPSLTHDLYQYLNAMIHIRETLDKTQYDNTTFVAEEKKIPYQNIPFPFNLQPSSLVNQIIILLHSHYNEEEIGIEYHTAKQLFSSRGIQLIKYEPIL